MDLTLTEKFLLLAQHPQKGHFLISSAHINSGLAGGMLLELSLDKLIRIENNQVRKEKAAKSVDDKLIKSIVAILEEGDDASVKSHITQLRKRSKDIKRSRMAALQEKNLIEIKNGHMLGILPYNRHYLVNREARMQLIEEVRSMILSKENNQVTLYPFLALIEAAKLYKVLARNRSELKDIRAIIRNLLNDDPISLAVATSIRRLQAAI